MLNTLPPLVAPLSGTQAVFAAVAKAAVTLLGAKRARVYVDDPAAQVLRVEASFTVDPNVEPSKRVFRTFAYGEGVVGSIFQSRKPEYIRDIQRDPRLVNRPHLRDTSVHAFAGLPLSTKDHAVGLLAILFGDRKPFTEEEKELMRLLADQAATAIENAQFYKKTEERLRQTETLLAVGQALGSTLELTEIFRRTTREMVRALGANMGIAWGLSPTGNELIPLGGYHLPPELVENYGRSPLPLEGVLIEVVKQFKGPVAVTDSQSDPRSDHPWARLVPHKSILAQPIWSRGELIGGFAVIWTQDAHEFTPDELRLTEGIAQQAAMAIQNARLLEAERRAGERLAASEARYRELVEKVNDIVYVHDLKGKILAINEAGITLSGYSREELLRMNFAQFLRPEDVRRGYEMTRRALAGERVAEFFTAEFIGRNGVRSILECNPRLIFKDGVPVAIWGIARDITARRKLEKRQAAFVNIVSELAAESEFDRLFPLIGERICRLLETDSAALGLVEGDELVFVGSYGFGETLPSSPHQKTAESRAGRVVLTGVPHSSSDMGADPHWREATVVVKLGYRAILEVPVVLRGEIIGVLATFQKSPRSFAADDVALLTSLASHTAVALDRTNLVRELKERLRETQTLLNVSEALTSTLDLTEMMRRLCRETQRALGAETVASYVTDEDLVLRPLAGYHIPKSLLDAIQTFSIPLNGHRFLEEAWERERPVFSESAADDARIGEIVKTLPMRSVLFFPMVVKGRLLGGVFAIWWERRHRFTPEELRLVEAMSRVAAMAIDRRQTEETLRQSEAQLRQSQKIEAVGRLAGGVAHDFNNLLTVIVGRGQLLQRRVPPDNPLRPEIDLILETAERAGLLTQQLLTFSRKQVIQPRVLDLNEVVTNTSLMLRQLIGEHIELATHLARGPARVKADPGQLDQVIVNLAVNARDAMPHGGRLTIATASVDLDEAFARSNPGARRGPYVTLTVSDIGCGMSAEIRSRVFEPFFTTKERGQGTGLGLSTVYGIVKQHDGYITVSSTPGEGTTVVIYLPRVEEIPEGTEEGAPSEGTRRGLETILLVEDEPAVRDLAREILVMHGYRVLEAGSGPEALDLAGRFAGTIHLVLTDVVMPRMSGPEMAHRLAQIRRDVKVVYMSGYAADAMGPYGVLDSHTAFLQKPFGADALVRKIREVLDSAGVARPAPDPFTRP